jgi:hypothetical protein
MCYYSEDFKLSRRFDVNVDRISPIKTEALRSNDWTIANIEAKCCGRKRSKSNLRYYGTCLSGLNITTGNLIQEGRCPYRDRMGWIQNWS